MSSENQLSPTHPLNKLAGVVSRLPLTDVLFYFSVALHENFSKDDGVKHIIQSMLCLMESRLNEGTPKSEPAKPLLKAKPIKKTALKKTGSSAKTELPELTPEDWEAFSVVYQQILDEENKA